MNGIQVSHSRFSALLPARPGQRDSVLTTCEGKKRMESLSELQRIEIELLLEAVFRHYGYDFRNYAFTTMSRRILERVGAENRQTISGLTEKLLHDPACLRRLLWDLSVGTTSVFREPNFYRAFSKHAIPVLRTFPFLRVWHAGCSSGEEVYSTAILLKEHGLYDRARIYATDFNEAVVDQARSGTFRQESIEEYCKNYEAAGRSGAFNDYYIVKNGYAVFDPSLKKNVTFAQHNLVTDGSFMEFNAIFCRYVMIYFDRKLRASVHELIYKSLSRLGILCLGKKESLHLTPHEPEYKELVPEEKIYQKSR